MEKPNPADDSKFFESGSVVLELCDVKSRQAGIRVCMPCCLFQTVSPHILGGGTVDELRIMDPISIWVPKLDKSRFIGPAASVDGVESQLNVALRAEAERMGKIFVHMSSHLADPSDLIPVLPLGTYITFLFRCRIDNVMKVLEGIDSIPVVGVREFQWSLASVLYKALSEFERADSSKRLNKLLLLQSTTVLNSFSCLST